MTDPIKAFQEEVTGIIQAQGKNKELQKAADEFMHRSIESKYSYNFSWMGRPCIQYPQDMVAMQQLIWELKPDLIIETGVAHGGSSVMYASFLELIGKGKIISIDIEIRPHNRKALEEHPMIKHIELIEASSTDEKVVEYVKSEAAKAETVLVVLDSNHTHEHVLGELQAYAELATVGSHVVVFDTIIENLPKGYFDNRPWDVGNSPMTALDEFLASNSNFVIDEHYDNLLQISAAPRGYLKRIK